MEDCLRSIVLVWHGNPYNNGEYRGTAFFISPGYLLTCKHVLGDIPFKEIFLQSDTGAWSEGGLRKIQQPILLDDIDVAYIPLRKPADNAYCIEFAREQDADLILGHKVRLSGHSRPGSSVEMYEVEICAYCGDYDLEVAHTSTSKGMSGGPVLRNGQLVGITRAKDDEHSYIIRLNSFRTFLPKLQGFNPYVHHASIPPNQLAELERILDGITLSDVALVNAFRSVKPELIDRLNIGSPTLFSDALDLLADCPHRAPGQAPLIEFLLMLPIANVVELENWQTKLAKELKIELQEIKNKIAVHPVQEQMLKPPVLMVKIEPDQLSSENKFRVCTWLFKDDNPSPIHNDDHSYSFEQLEQSVPDLLSQAKRQLVAAEAKNLLVEIIAPLSLWFWNISRVPAKAGTLKLPLGELYVLAMRSWERIYHQDYDSIRHQWIDKWTSCIRCPINIDQIHIENDISSDSKMLYYKLQDEYLGFAALFPIDSIPLRTLFGSVLAAGVPFAFWPASSLDPSIFIQCITELIQTNNHSHWPKALHEKRKRERNHWHELQLLWDIPEHTPPDAKDYKFLAPK